jgi:nitrous oxidase accessory protein
MNVVGVLGGVIRFLVLLLVCHNVAAVKHPSFQALVDATEPNGTLVPPPGIYSGPVILDFPITIDGRGEVTIDAGGKGSVIYIDTDGTVIKNRAR